MIYQRPRFLPILLTFAVVLFLWLPPACLYGVALWQVATQQPARLLEALPLQALPRSLFLNTLILGVLTAGVAIVCGVPVAIAIARGPRRLRGPGLLLAALPLALPPTLGATAYLELTRTPPARSMASLAATHAMPFPPVLVTAVVLALCYFPLITLPLQAALRTLPADLEDAALLFENGWGVWKHVLWPLVAPAIWGAAGLVGALAIWEMGAPDLLDARTYAVQIYRELSAADNLDAQGKAVKAALTGVPMLILGCLALWPALRALRFYGAQRSGITTSPRADTALPGDLTIENLIASPLAWLVLAISPVAILLVFVLQIHPLHVIADQWTTNSVEIANTAEISSGAALVITLLGFGLTTLWRNWPPRARRWALALCVAPLLVAPLMLAVSLINFWDRPQFALIYGGVPYNGNDTHDWLIDIFARYSMTLIGYTARFLPLAVLLLNEASRRVDDDLLEAARNLGATSFRAVGTILAPLLAPALLGVFALLWALCAAELSLSVLINPPGGQTLPVPIFNLMHIGSTAEVAALSLTLAAMSGVAIILAALGLRFWSTRR